MKTVLKIVKYDLNSILFQLYIYYWYLTIILSFICRDHPYHRVIFGSQAIGKEDVLLQASLLRKVQHDKFMFKKSKLFNWFL